MLPQAVERPVQWLFLTRSLTCGGSQRQLVELVRSLAQRNAPVAVATLYDGGPMRAELQGTAAPVFSLAKQTRWDLVRCLARLVKLVRRMRPMVVHGYLGTANILALLAKIAAPSVTVVWGIRASNMDLRRYGWLDRTLYRLESRLSRFSDLIIVNSERGWEYAVAQGFPAEKMLCIPNGIDTERFKPDAEAGRRFRRRQRVGEDIPLIGLVGRIDPMKGHRTFLEAAAALIAAGGNARFVCVGNGEARRKKELRAQSERLGVAGLVTWLDEHDPIEEVYNGLDLLTSCSSYGEGFSNVVAEAMACGCPCVVTDVGDAGRIVGETGCIVTPDRSDEVVAAWEKLLSFSCSERANVGHAARDRIVRHFGLDRLVEASFSALTLAGSFK
ncbi:Glycosyl transferase group 1 [Nitrospira japonica]|uniref:Glycosyl transferase group 1 n=1 Tax=Nitrospira japonica TaxID=1325564 RepID=A0A1W1IBF9_9BACT|nr:glycosyltransferase [Nitrospira japonica]SLM50315.1 Glycosyl transferase group 1 [Nitrospira japonica]